LSVTASICCWTSTLIRSRSDRASSSDRVPITERRAVRARASIATSKLAMLKRACLASTTWVKIVALTATTTLSLVITSWRSPGRGNSRMSTITIESMNGMIRTRPGSWMPRNSPSRLTTPTEPCWTRLTTERSRFRAKTMIRMIRTRTTIPAIAEGSI